MSESAPGFEKYPDYRVDIDQTEDRIRVLVGEVAIADSSRPLKVTESKHHPVWYLPLADVDGALLEGTSHSTYCPFKGHASYWTINAAGQKLEDSVWGYEDPYVECEPLKDHVAFYTDRVQLEINGEKQAGQTPGWTD